MRRQFVSVAAWAAAVVAVAACTEGAAPGAKPALDAATTEAPASDAAAADAVTSASDSAPANQGGGTDAQPTDISAPSDAIALDTATPDVTPDSTPQTDGAAAAATADTADAAPVDAAVADATTAADVDAIAAEIAADTVDLSDGASAAVPGDCPEHALVVYIVSADDKLVRFSPLQVKFTPIATLSCLGEDSSPFSMSVDRQGSAWVLYNSGKVYRVNTVDGACTAMPFVPDQNGFDVFGMGFSADGPGLTTEQLYIAGGGKNGFITGPNKLATIDLQTLKVKVIATLNPAASGPDLSGNGNGELWGFFPETKPPSVRQIDKGTATTGQTFALPMAEFSGISSWAFASWGGNFYLFSRNSKQAASAVYRLSTGTGGVDKIVASLGYTVVGAGVSSCAPTMKP